MMQPPLRFPHGDYPATCHRGRRKRFALHFCSEAAPKLKKTSMLRAKALHAKAPNCSILTELQGPTAASMAAMPPLHGSSSIGRMRLLHTSAPFPSHTQHVRYSCFHSSNLGYITTGVLLLQL